MLERLRIWLHAIPLGERINANRILLTLLLFLLLPTLLFLGIYLDVDSEGMKKADQRARVIASNLIQPNVKASMLE